MKRVQARWGGLRGWRPVPLSGDNKRPFDWETPGVWCH